MAHLKLPLCSYGFPSEIIGKGGYGTIFKYETSKGQCAVKSVVNDADCGLDKSTLNEVIFLNKLKHKNIIALEDISVTSYGISLVLPLADCDLYKYITTVDNIDPIFIKKVFYQVCQAILYLKKHDIIHGDIKSTNILIKGDNIWLADFGSAQDLRRNDLSLSLCSIPYCAPEIYLEDTISSKSDVWSFGCLMVEVFYRYILFYSKTGNELIQSIIDHFGLPSDLEYPKFESCLRRLNYTLTVYPNKIWDDKVKLCIPDVNLRLLIIKMLNINHKNRIDIEFVITDQYFDSVREIDTISVLEDNNNIMTQDIDIMSKQEYMNGNITDYPRLSPLRKEYIYNLLMLYNINIISSDAYFLAVYIFDLAVFKLNLQVQLDLRKYLCAAAYIGHKISDRSEIETKTLLRYTRLDMDFSDINENHITKASIVILKLLNFRFDYCYLLLNNYKHHPDLEKIEYMTMLVFTTELLDKFPISQLISALALMKSEYDGIKDENIDPSVKIIVDKIKRFEFDIPDSLFASFKARRLIK
jgi:serine/threonine protein kinase